MTDVSSFSDGHIARRVSGGKYDGPDPRTVNILDAEIKRLWSLIDRKDKLAERASEQLSEVGKGLTLLSIDLGLDVDEMDHSEIIQAIREAIQIPELCVAHR